jgi:undecaprenyl diphosphate synthase
MQHLAMVMDGNRRWAKRYGFQPWQGHKEGTKAVERVIKFCVEQGIKHLSLYAFSLENFNRTPEELKYLFSLIVDQAETQLDTCLDNGVRMRFVGDRSRFPEQTVAPIERLEKKTEHLDKLIVHFLFCYGGRQEIVASVKSIVQKIKQGLLTEDQINEATFADSLWMRGVPDPELIVRTGGAQRLSNFLLYEAAYSELYFLDCLWPEVTTDHLNDMMTYFANCKRNFGV